MIETEITSAERLRLQLIWDMLRLKRLNRRITPGEAWLESERDELDAAIQVKLAIVRGIDKRIWGK